MEVSKITMDFSDKSIDLTNELGKEIAECDKEFQFPFGPVGEIILLALQEIL